MRKPTRIAIVGTGMAGATCARRLADAGHSVQLFDKSRGVGGRLATRRAQWPGDDGHTQRASFDHGTPGFSARSPDFTRFVEQAERDGLLARWAPAMAPRSYVPLDNPALWVPTPDMPSLCRALLSTLPVTLGCSVDELRRGPAGWQIISAGALAAESFTDVIVAIPPQQAAPLLQPHQAVWGQRAHLLPMSPCWTLMAVTNEVAAVADWDLAWPTQGPLASIVRNDGKPGRERVPGQSHWVAHANAAWSQTHLESPAAEVQAALQNALAPWLGGRPAWRHLAVHRWRYASVPRADAAASAMPTSPCWWDASLGLGVCGDALGGAGVEGAWASGRAMAAAIIERGW